MTHTRLFSRERIALAFMLPVILLAVRVLYTGTSAYMFLLWNLFLAWLPLLFSYIVLRTRRTMPIAAPIFAVAWLLFLPNAPYLVTDIPHSAAKIRRDKNIGPRAQVG